MILDFLAVRAVADIGSVLCAELHGRRYGQRDSLVGRSEQYVEVGAVFGCDRFRIVAAQPAELFTGAVKTGIYKEWCIAAAFGHESTKFQDLTIHHKFNKFLFILFH